MADTNRSSVTQTASEQLLRKRAEEVNVILIVGLTGAGKSYFINSIAGEGRAPVGDDLESFTEKCSVIAAEIGRKKVLLVDTPGFNDTNYVKNSDATILADIAKVLTKQYELGASLKGVIYMHNIQNNRYEGTAVKNLLMFQKIVGDPNLENVILTTTQWSKVKESEGAKRENELRSKFWGLMISKGSHMARYHGDRDSAVAIVSQLLGKPGVVLDMQRELASGKRLEETSAGSLVSENLAELQAMLQQERREVEALQQEALADKGLLAETQKLLENNRAHLAQTDLDEKALRAKIQDEVRGEWREKFEKAGKREKNGRKAYRGGLTASVVSVAGLAVHIFMAMFGIPSGFVDTITDWF